ncbi:hypothetical protein ACFLU6_08020 [Acidobacteriota bacterium]
MPRKKPQSLCPVKDQEIDKSVYIDFQGQRIYFCREGCIPTFKSSPEKYMKKIEEQGILLESFQKTCPLSGEAIDKSCYIDHKGRRVYFCTRECVDEFKKNPDVYLKVLDIQQGERTYGCGVDKKRE